jgi:geranylgeranyl diphosphate synthase type II
MAALFGGQRDAKFLATINREIINSVIDTEIEFYKHVVESSNSNLYGESEKVGKQKGGDILADKKTILSILARSSANSSQKEELIQIQKETNVESKINRTIDLFQTLNIKENCVSVMEDYYLKAKKSIEAIETESSKDKLLTLFKILQQRQY